MYGSPEADQATGRVMRISTLFPSATDDTGVKGEFCQDQRPGLHRIATWERTSCPLVVSEGYRKFFTLFANHFKNEMAGIHDPDLKRELTVLKKLTKHITALLDTDGKLLDDWKILPDR